MKKPEILAPAGSYQAMEAAVKAGADAVYMGGTLFGARAYAKNPNQEELVEAIYYTHFYDKKLYLTLNTLLKEEEMQLVGDYLLPYYEAGLDGIIIQDPGVFSFVKRNFPGLFLHASTQMNVTGVAAAKLLKEMGASRIVPARELSISEIRAIKQETGLEIETFVHGALCYCYSGRCLMSSILGGRSGNRGRCAQPCRLPYEVQNSGKPSYILSPKDLCTIEILPELFEAGIDSLKIEGRMKNPEYVAAITSLYRKYTDQYMEHPDRPYQVEKEDWQQLLEAYNRGGFTKGYYHTYHGPEMMSTKRPNHQGIEVGKIEKIKGGQIFFHPAVRIGKGDLLEIGLADGQKVELTSPCDCPKGQNLALNGQKLSRLKPGAMILRTQNPWLKKKMSDEILTPIKKRKIYGYAQFQIGHPARLVLWTNVGQNGERVNQVETKGDVVLQARERPLDKEQIGKPLLQTGNTRFEFLDLSIDLEEGAFISMGALKKLRREGLSNLKSLLEQRNRRVLPCAPVFDPISNGKKQEKQGKTGTAYEIRVSVEDKTHLSYLLDHPKIDSLCIPLEELDKEERNHILEEAKIQKKKIYYSFPRVFRKKEQVVYDEIWKELENENPEGFLIHNIDELAWIRKKGQAGKKLILSHSLYGYNQEAVEVYHTLLDKGMSVCHTMPLELNKRELSQVDYGDKELLIYGRIPLMVTAQCVAKNEKSCQNQSGYWKMTDRYQKSFYLRRHCVHCYNTVWNGVPLSLYGCRHEWEPLCPSALRFHFTIEKEAEIAAILDTFLGEEKETVSGIKEFTRGHWKRGVE